MSKPKSKVYTHLEVEDITNELELKCNMLTVDLIREVMSHLDVWVNNQVNDREFTRDVYVLLEKKLRDCS